MKQVIVIRKDLNMSVGKTAAQAAHASIQFMFRSDWDCEILRLWRASGMTKIVVGVDSLEEFYAIKDAAERAELTVNAIFDEARTELSHAQYTALAIGPDLADVIDPITRHLRLLK